MVNKWIPIAMKVPLLLLVFVSFGASIYAAYNKIQGITYATPIIFGIIMALYFIGWYLESRGGRNGVVQT